MENKDILNALQNYEMTFGTSENIFNGGLLTDAERDFVTAMHFCSGLSQINR